MSDPYIPSVATIVATRDRPELLRQTLAAIDAQDYEGSITTIVIFDQTEPCLLYTSPSPRDATLSRMPSSA